MRDVGKKNARLILVIIDLITLLVTFILTKNLFLILLLLNIVLITIVIPILLYSQLLTKQGITPKDYYMATVEKEYRYLDNNLLTLMFELRMANLRNFIFSYLAFLLVFTLTIAFNPEKVRQYLHFSPEYFVLVGVIGILSLVYYSFRLDRETITELKELFKAMKKLDQLKKEANDESIEDFDKRLFLRG